MSKVSVVDVYLTGVCNLSCRYCFGESDLRGGMKREIFKVVVALARQMGASALEFCGGEPLLYRDLAWAVEVGQQQGFKLILRTNGLLLPRHRTFVASSFAAVGISLDGDAEHNNLMRPHKGPSTLTSEEKFRIPLGEVRALKELNPNIQVILASVATRTNTAGLRSLARVLLRQKTPLDLWKVYQFVPNNFRAKQNKDDFLLDLPSFRRLEQELSAETQGAFPLISRTSEEIDGSCLVVNSEGDLLSGSRCIGNVMVDSSESLVKDVEGLLEKIEANKSLTYPAIGAK